MSTQQIDRLVQRGIEDALDAEALLASVGGEIADCPHCLERVRSELEVAQRFQSDIQPAMLRRVQAELRTREPRPALGWRWALFGAGGLVGAAAIALLLLAGPPPSDTRSKGTVSMRVEAVRGGSAFAPSAQNPLREGDALQFYPRAEGYWYVTLLSLDAAGRASAVLKEGDGSSVELGTGPLPASFVLDAAPGPERLLVIYSELPLSDADARGIATQHGSGGRSEEPRWEATLLLLPKESGP